MLVLARYQNQGLTLKRGDESIRIYVASVRPGSMSVRLGIEADKEWVIHRDEIWQAIEEQNNRASKTPAVGHCSTIEGQPVAANESAVQEESCLPTELITPAL